MFYVPIIIIQCEDWNEKKEKLEKIFEERKKYISRNNNDDCNTDFFQKNVKFRQEYEEITKIFSDELLIMKNEFKLKDSLNLYITTSWFEVSNYGDCHNAHTHGNSGYSAVCYIDYNPDLHTPTVFISPFKNFLDGDDMEHTPKNIQEGTLIFFPSSILHYTRPNRSDVPRRILSFNLKSDTYV